MTTPPTRISLYLESLEALFDCMQLAVNTRLVSDPLQLFQQLDPIVQAKLPDLHPEVAVEVQSLLALLKQQALPQ